MKANNMKRIHYFILVLLFLVPGCEKNNSNITGDYRIKSIVHTVHSEIQGYYEFIYNGENLIQLLWYDSETGRPDPYNSWNISYSQNGIVKEFFGVDITETQHIDMKQEFILDLNNIVQISTQSLQNDTWTTSYNDEFAYDQNRLIRFERTSGPGSNIAYASQENISYEGDSLIICDYYHFSRDTFHQVRSLSYKDGLLDELVFYQYNPDSVEVITEYNYDANDLLINATVLSNSNPLTVLFEFTEDGLLSKQKVSAVEFDYVYEPGKGNADQLWHSPIDFIYISPSLVNIIGR